MKTITTTELLEDFDDKLAYAMSRPIALERSGQSVAVLISMNEWTRLEGLADHGRSAWLESFAAVGEIFGLDPENPQDWLEELQELLPAKAKAIRDLAKADFEASSDLTRRGLNQVLDEYVDPVLLGS